ARTHLVVSKRDAPGGARAEVAPVSDDARLAEIARLMSGRQTAAALRRADELLAEGGTGGAATALAVRTM
ncbi:MAG: hypothetical protein JOZ46_01810, partial [Candidatus Dormibacteraeota bacterium]|nr:hypothetical protein [Candidatus Dormibacteraeota bacterium]